MPSSPEAPARLRAQQLAFAAHLRDPEGAPPPPGIEDRRMAVYRELFYNTVEGLLAGNFPVMRRLFADDDWHALIRGFYREHRCQTPLFPEVGREFMRWIEARQQQGAGDPPWLLELAHYEWVELALAIDENDPDAIAHDPAGDLLAGVPLASPLAWPLAYRYPVHRIGPSFRPDAPGEAPTFVLVVRGRDDEVRFKTLSAAGFTLMQRLHGNEGATGRELLEAMAAEAGAADREAFVAAGAALMQQLREREAILGTRLDPSDGPHQGTTP